MKSVRSRIKSRVKKFIELDVDGFRSYILFVVLRIEKFTVDELYDFITRKYDVSRSVVASMIGYIHSKLGILRSHKESYKTPIVYSLRKEYEDLLKMELSKKQRFDSNFEYVWYQ